MKVLYQSIIGQHIRKLLGEYYTPDWLAERVVSRCVDDPLRQRVLDPSCGSGTFLFHAVRRYLVMAEAAGRSTAAAILGAAEAVIGIDIHPVACTLARVTYLLAIGMERLRADDRPQFTVPVYLGDSLLWGQEPSLLSYRGLSVPTSDDPRTFPIDAGFADSTEFEDRLKFPDRIVSDVQR